MMYPRFARLSWELRFFRWRSTAQRARFTLQLHWYVNQDRLVLRARWARALARLTLAAPAAQWALWAALLWPLLYGLVLLGGAP